MSHQPPAVAAAANIHREAAKGWRVVDSALHIEFEPAVHAYLMTVFHAVRKEFSGFGFMRKAGDAIIVYDFILLDVGSEAYTEIPTRKILPLLDRPDASAMKVWLHCHPMGDGVPGFHNWSGTDEHTAIYEPLGGLPELAKWSVSIVLTPRGWVGRIDNYVKKVTSHLPVLQPAAYRDVAAILKEKAPRQVPFVSSWAPYRGGWTPLVQPSLSEYETSDDEIIDYLVEIYQNQGPSATVAELLGDLGVSPEDELELIEEDPGLEEWAMRAASNVEGMSLYDLADEAARDGRLLDDTYAIAAAAATYGWDAPVADLFGKGILK